LTVRSFDSICSQTVEFGPQLFNPAPEAGGLSRYQPNGETTEKYQQSIVESAEEHSKNAPADSHECDQFRHPKSAVFLEEFNAAGF